MNTIILLLVLVPIVGFAIYSYIQAQKNKNKSTPKPLVNLPRYIPTDFDNQLKQLINQYRLNNKLDILMIDLELAKVSYSHSEYMAKKQLASHDYFMNRQATFPNRLLGEVVAWNYHTPESTLQAWKNSPAHNAVLLNPNYTRIGLSYANDQKGRRYVCALLSS